MEWHTAFLFFVSTSGRKVRSKTKDHNTWIHKTWSFSFQTTCQCLKSGVLFYVININDSKKEDFLFLNLPKESTANQKFSANPVVHYGAWL